MAATRKRTKRNKEGFNSRRTTIAWPRFLWAWLLVLVITIVAAVIHVRAKLAAVELGYALSAAVSEHQQIQDDQQKLRVEVATLRSPQRLRKLAVEKFGLVEPGSAKLLRFGQIRNTPTALSRVVSR